MGQVQKESTGNSQNAIHDKKFYHHQRKTQPESVQDRGEEARLLLLLLTPNQWQISQNLLQTQHLKNQHIKNWRLIEKNCRQTLDDEDDLEQFWSENRQLNLGQPVMQYCAATRMYAKRCLNDWTSSWSLVHCVSDYIV